MRFRDSIHVFSGYNARDGSPNLLIERRARGSTFGLHKGGFWCLLVEVVVSAKESSKKGPYKWWVDDMKKQSHNNIRTTVVSYLYEVHSERISPIVSGQRLQNGRCCVNWWVFGVGISHDDLSKSAFSPFLMAPRWYIVPQYRQQQLKGSVTTLVWSIPLLWGPRTLAEQSGMRWEELGLVTKFSMSLAPKSHSSGFFFWIQLTRPARTLFTDVFSYYRGFLAEIVTLSNGLGLEQKILFSQFSNITTFKQHNVLTKVSSSNNKFVLVFMLSYMIHRSQSYLGCRCCDLGSFRGEF